MSRYLLPFLIAVAAIPVGSHPAAASEAPVIQMVTGLPADPRPFELPETEPAAQTDLSLEPSEPMPIRTPAQGGVSRSQREMISYDLRTRVERRATAAAEGQQRLRQTAGGPGEAILLEAEPGKDFTGLSLVSNPEIGVFPRHVKIFMKFMNSMSVQKTYQCSGTLIDPKHVITAGHCVYLDEDDDGVPIDAWAFDVEVFPGYDNGEGIMGSAKAVQLHSWTGWTQDRDYDHDIAVIDLDRPVGALAGWRGYGHTSDFDYYENGAWTRYVYPGKDHNGVPVYDGQRMYLHAGTFDFEDDPQVGFDRDMYKGTSGGGAIKDNAVFAIRSHAEIGSDYQYSWDTRITSGKFDDIGTWLSADQPSSPDLVALDVRADITGGTVGTQIQGLNFLVHNYSKAAFNGSVYYTVYLSYNSTISTSDIYVTSGTVAANLGSMASMRINAGATAYIPSVTTGSFTLGVILTNVDADTNNNDTQGDDTMPLDVLCNTTGVPVLAVPDNQHPCVPTTVTLNWGSVPAIGVTYQVQVGTVPQTGPITSTASTQILMQNLTEGTRYYWRVRAVASCGALGTWSSSWWFQTEGNLNGVSRNEPAPDRACLDTTVDFSWDAMPHATLYQVWIMDLGGGNNHYFYSDTTSGQYSGLTPGVRYHWAIRARDACGQWGTYGSRTPFYIKAAAALTPTPLTPADGAFTGADVFFQAELNHLTTKHEFEVQTAAGAPAYFQQVHGDALWVLSMNEGDYRWRTRASTCTTGGEVWGPWTGWQTFTVDLTAPEFASPPSPVSPPLDTWTANDLVTVEWQAATDPAGVAEYWIAFDQSPLTTPDGTTVAPSAGGWEAQVPDGENWFHIVAVDAVGNVSAPLHLGPFLVDTGPPSPPVITANLEPTTPTNVDEIVVTWPASTDAGSGVAGYSFEWSTSSTSTPDAIVDTTELTATLSPAPEGNRWFRIRAIDNLGHASDVVQGRYFVDRSPPTFNFVDMNPQPPYATGQMIELDYVIQDNFGPARVYTLHYYSVDGGSFWYDALCAGGVSGCTFTGPNPLNPPANGGDAWGPYPWRAPWVPPGSSVLYKIVAIDEAGNAGEYVVSDPFSIITPTAADDLPEVTQVTLRGNTPNPFNPSTTIRFGVPEPSDVRLAIFDLRGRLVRTLVREHRNGPAWHEAVWDGTNDRGESVASGVYVYRLDAGGHSVTRRMSLLK